MERLEGEGIEDHVEVDTEEVHLGSDDVEDGGEEEEERDMSSGNTNLNPGPKR